MSLRRSVRPTTWDLEGQNKEKNGTGQMRKKGNEGKGERREDIHIHRERPDWDRGCFRGCAISSSLGGAILNVS